MAIYNPPQKDSYGSTLSTAGSALMSGAGILASTGVGAPVAGVVAGLGAVASLAGTVINGNNEAKLNSYNQRYKTISQGQENEAISYASIAANNRKNYIQQGVASSVNAIQDYVGGTGFKNIKLG